MVDSLNKNHFIDIAVLAWYVLFAAFFIWTAFTVVPTTAAALNSSSYAVTMQGYVESLILIIFIFIAAYAVLIYLARGKHPDHKHIFPWIKRIYPTEGRVGSLVIFALFALCIFIVAIYLRTTMLQFFGFYEPDGFYYYSVVRAALNNGFQVPSVLSISGWPSHAPFTEAKGLILIPLAIYAVLQYVGTSYYTAIRISPVIFGILDMLAAYMLSRYLSKDKFFGLLVLAFVGFSMGNAARTSALIFRGDTFVSFFLLVALILFVEFFRQETRNRKILFAVLAGIALVLANFVWNGASFGLATFMFAFVILVFSAFVMRKEQLVNDSMYLLLSLVVWFVLALLAHAVGFIVAQQFVGLTFVPVFLGLALFYGFVYALTRNIQNTPILQSLPARLCILGGILIIGALVFVVVEPGLINAIFVSNGFISAPGSFGTTIQELQPPTAQFLYTSFDLVLLTSPPTLFGMYLPLYFNFFNTTPPPPTPSCNIITTCNGGIIDVLLILLLFIPYYFMQIYDSGGFLSGSARVRPDLNIAMMTIMAYFLLTVYLQMHAIRFNSLVSIPIAIIAAYTLYWLTAFVMGRVHTPNQKLIVGALVCIFFIAFFYYLLSDDNGYAQTLAQADSINPTFISALQWLKANAPTNSVVLTLWPDGSVVEGVSNLTAVTDSVGSQNGTKADPFAAWILNSSDDPQFLTSSLSGSPNYLLVRFPWLIETQGIYTESLITENATYFGYLPLTQFSEGATNASTKQIIFRNSPTGYPYGVVNLREVNATTDQNTIYGYIQESATQTSPFENVGFYNILTGNYTFAPQTQLNDTNGETLVVQYSDVPRTGFFFNITGAYIFGPGIGNSNMVKFLYFCSYSQCLWNNNQSTMQMVYQNPDTKIFKITYLN